MAFAERVGQAWNDTDVTAEKKIEEAGIELYEAFEPVISVMQTAAQALENT